jgi:predicted esterase
MYRESGSAGGRLHAAAGIALLLAQGIACNARRPRGTTPTIQAEVHGVHVVRVLPRSSDRETPLVVALHGRGGTAEHFASLWLDVDLDVAVPQGFSTYEWGYAWFDWPKGVSEEELAIRVIAAADRLWPAIAEIAHGRKVAVIGFSQGAVLAFVLAARHPEAVVYAFPIAGSTPSQIFLPGRAPAPVYAVHGADDRVIPIVFDRTAISAFKEHGGVVELREFPGAGHKVTDEIRADVLAHLRSVVAAARMHDAAAP